MSVFQTQEWWSVRLSDSEEYDLGCMVVGNLDNASPPSNKIAVGSQTGMLRMYLPTRPQYRIEDLVLEESFGAPILQILCGRFLPGSSLLALAVLHSRVLVVYEITPHKEKDNRLNYYSLTKAYQHG